MRVRGGGGRHWDCRVEEREERHGRQREKRNSQRHGGGSDLEWCIHLKVPNVPAPDLQRGWHPALTREGGRRFVVKCQFVVNRFDFLKSRLRIGSDRAAGLGVNPCSSAVSEPFVIC